MTATAPAVDEGTLLSSHLIRASSLPGVLAALEDSIGKLTRRLPDVEIVPTFEEVTEEDGSPLTWCYVHRSFVPPKQNCWRAEGDTTPCYRREADALELEIRAEGLPLFDGEWVAAGVLTTDETGVTTATSVRLDEDGWASKYLHLTGTCDHCHTVRTRNVTVLLRNEVDGEVRAVGRSCLADYTGGSIRAELLPILIGLRERFATEIGVALGNEPTTAPVVDVVAVATLLIERHGFVKSGWGDIKNPDTKTRLMDCICPAKESTRQEVVPAELTKEQLDAARAAIDLVAGMDDDSDYITNLQAVIANEYVQVTGKRGKLGLLASLPAAAERKRDRIAKQEAERAGRVDGWIGEVKQRRQFTGLVRTVRCLGDNGWGDSYLVVLDTDEGTVKWFASREPEFDRDDTVTLLATIKGHGEYQDAKETVITRAKVISHLPATAAADVDAAAS